MQTVAFQSEVVEFPQLQDSMEFDIVHIQVQVTSMHSESVVTSHSHILSLYFTAKQF